MGNTLYFMANNAAVDAVMITKAEAIDGIRETYGLSIDKVAAIGDEIIDLPMLGISGLGKIGTVANAQAKVIDYVSSMVNGHVSKQSVYDGFLEFYKICQESGIRLIVTDRDGVIKEADNVQWGPLYAELAMKMGNEGYPYCTILTGSALSQNEKFRHQYGLDERLIGNVYVKENPYLLIVENGAIHVNVITGETKNYCSRLNLSLLGALKGPFESEVARRIQAEILPQFGLSMSYSYEDQAGKVYHIIDKQAGVTFNIPRTDKAGNQFRKTLAAQSLRDMEIEVMCDVASNLGMNYTIL